MSEAHVIMIVSLPGGAARGRMPRRGIAASAHPPTGRPTAHTKGNAMTDPNYTAMLLVIDRSGSMSSIRDDMIGGVTQLLNEQAAQPGLLTVDVVTFDNIVEWQHSFADPANVQIELVPRGSTALYDALGGAIAHFGQKLADLPEHARPGVVTVAVVTDGYENASTEWTARAVSDAVTRQRDAYGWDFVFLGANHDAALTAASIGIDADASLDFSADASSVAASASHLSRYVGDVRRGTRTGFTSEERRSALGDES